jgi:hypothetical protein
MSRAVDMWPSSVRPWALRKVVRVMPSARAVRFMRRAKAASEPEIASAIAVAASLADRIAAARMRKRKRIVEPARRPSFDGGSAARRGDAHLRVEVDLAQAHRLERDVERHHLGQRRGVKPRVGVAGMQHLARPGVHHHRRVRGRARRRKHGNAQNDNQPQQRGHQTCGRHETCSLCLMVAVCCGFDGTLSELGREIHHRKCGLGSTVIDRGRRLPAWSFSRIGGSQMPKRETDGVPR